MFSDVEKYVKLYSQYDTVVLLDELCRWLNFSIRKFSLDTCCRIDALKKVILDRTGDRSGNDNI